MFSFKYYLHYFVDVYLENKKTLASPNIYYSSVPVQIFVIEVPVQIFITSSAIQQ